MSLYLPNVPALEISSEAVSTSNLAVLVRLNV